MNRYNQVIGIWWNISQPNPRLPAYVIPALLGTIWERAHEIILVSSLDASKKNAENDSDARKIEFNTLQKIKCLAQFKQTFYPHGPNISFEAHTESDEIEDAVWLEIWWEIEKICTPNEIEYIQNILSNFAGKHSLETAKIYAVRHAIWFFDIWFESSPEIFETLWWPQETIFNKVRDKISSLSPRILDQILQRQTVKNDVRRVIYPYTSRVIQYWEATRKSWKRRISVEYPISERWNIWDHYNQRLARKSNLHSDIWLIYEHINPEAYQDFWNDFSHWYTRDFLNT